MKLFAIQIQKGRTFHIPMSPAFKKKQVVDDLCKRV
jgi:hypothetical protein